LNLFIEKLQVFFMNLKEFMIRKSFFVVFVVVFGVEKRFR
jgi:hypothetical protein